MKRLKKIRLINWHRFVDETILVGDSVLISGENGAGKSTLLDAIQLVITCSKNNFNKAAHEKGKRTLNTYMRCKTGIEERPYERLGEISSHIALEFYDESRNSPFIVGAVMDSASEDKEPNIAWYLCEKKEIIDSLFLQGEKIKSISTFRNTNKCTNFVNTQSEARKMMSARFGRLEEKFFALIPKALAFRPIHDIKDFVYSYVLDEKEVNIDSLKENVRSYQDLERMLEDVKVRIAELEKIIEKKTETDNFLRIDRYQEFYLSQVAVDITYEEQEKTVQNEKYAELRKKEEEAKKNSIERERDTIQEMLTALQAELSGNEEYIALENLKKQEEELEDYLRGNQEKIKELRTHVRKSLDSTQKLLEVRDVDNCIAEYANLLGRVEELEELANLRLCLEQVISYKKEMFGRVSRKLAEADMKKSQKEEQLRSLQNKIENLEKKRFTYPTEVVTLMDGIKAEFAKLNRSGEVRVLCELLEITNAAWQNAVEGYLNTQRFYLLVEPDNFDLALSVYDRLRENKKAYGAGLINAGKLEKYDDVPEGSLAEVVQSRNVWAKRYINMVLGKVTRCQSYQELKKYPTAITRQCMRYQNHVVSAIRPEIYKTPYIGQDAYLKQLENAKLEQVQTKNELEQIEEQIQNLKYVQKPLEVTEDMDVKYHLSDLEDQRKYTLRLAKCQEKIKELKQNSTVLQKQIQAEQLKEDIKKLNNDISDIDQRVGQLQRDAQYAQEHFQELQERVLSEKAVLMVISDKLGTELADCKKEYDKLVGGRNLEEFKKSYEISKKGNWTRKENAENEMISLMRKYKVAHDFGAAESMIGFVEFDNEYHKLKDSQLLSYEEKVQKARSAAEEEFREQFLSRLQENIKQAQGELKELNRALEDIHFSRERYVFQSGPSKKLKKYYDMIMDDFNLLDGESIFSGLFRENHREVIDELFEKLTVNDEASAKVLEEFTDYRTYMEYDLEIKNDDGTYMLYSKVSREKSGGETQTPFYITVAASFMQLYRNSIGGDAIGLVMLDEAFNNMDDERIAGVLNFMTNANLQLIVAAPPDKIQYIAPAMKKVLLVLRDDDISYVEDFTKV